MSIQTQTDSRTEGGSAPLRQRIQTAALLIWVWIALGLLIALGVREMFHNRDLMAIVVFFAVLFVGWCAREVWRQPVIYWPRVWRLFQGEPLVWDESEGRWAGKWSYQKRQADPTNLTDSTDQKAV